MFMQNVTFGQPKSKPTVMVLKPYEWHYGRQYLCLLDSELTICGQLILIGSDKEHKNTLW